MSRKHPIFVYGTLKRGFWNNRLLEDSTFVGTATTVREFCLLDGGYPYACRRGKKMRRVVGELWLVDSETLARLDCLEGVPHHYQRQLIGVVVPGGRRRRAHIYTVPYGDERQGRQFCPTDNDGAFVWRPQA